MATGVRDYIWSLEEIVGLLERPGNAAGMSQPFSHQWGGQCERSCPPDIAQCIVHRHPQERWRTPILGLLVVTLDALDRLPRGAKASG